MRNPVNKHILVFDSGLGGTTILKEIHARLPSYAYSYAMDNNAFPYGNKANDYLLERSVKLFEFLINHSHPDLIVIACNTASTLILDKLRSQFDTPFVGVVPAIKPAAATSESKVIGLLATEATIGRDYIKELNNEYAGQCEVIQLGSQKLVELAEDKLKGNPVDTVALHKELKSLKEHPLANKIDTFVLGCTHFPAIKNEIATIWPHKARWIDSGEAIARRVDELCQNITSKKQPKEDSLRMDVASLKDCPIRWKGWADSFVKHRSDWVALLCVEGAVRWLAVVGDFCAGNESAQRIKE